ncbi:MAG: hypothetical protein U9N72_07380 [Bacteroidota bacterium]|nr:hypothetical protein [Bacteroidota bacterium]
MKNKDLIYKSIRIAFILLLLSNISPWHLYSQDDNDADFGLFKNESILNIKLAFDIETFMKEKPEEEYLDAEITIYLDETDSIFEKIKVCARGNYRRRTCDFPPIMLNFKGAKTGYSDLDDLGRVKLVSHCMPGEDYQTYVMREYLAYKIYNIITDYSFRVRLMNISYYDIKTHSLYANNKIAFILEPVDFLEKRFGKDELEDIEITDESVINDIVLKLSVFEYLIANSDWSIPMIHNLKIFGDEDTRANSIVVPYDFDYSGWVNTHYSVAREDLGLKDIRNRAFLGPCRSEEEWRDVLDYYQEKENNIIDMIEDFEYLKRRERNDLVRYVESFYRLYRDDKIISIFMEACNQ